MTRARLLRTGLRGLAVVGVLLSVVTVRVVTSSRAELSRAERLMGAGDVDAAMSAYRRAARLYAPANPYSSRALDRLAQIATEAEAAQDPERALAAWRSVRGAILASRSVYVPNRSRLERAEQALAALRAPSRGDEPAVRRSPERPHLAWTIVALLGWLGWTGGAFAFAQRAMDSEDRVVGRAARLWGTIVVLGFGVFVIGLALA